MSYWIYLLQNTGHIFHYSRKRPNFGNKTYGLNAANTKGHQYTWSWANLIQFTSSEPVSERSNLILLSHLLFSLPTGHFPEVCPTRIMYAFVSPICQRSDDTADYIVQTSIQSLKCDSLYSYPKCKSTGALQFLLVHAKPEILPKTPLVMNGHNVNQKLNMNCLIASYSKIQIHTQCLSHPTCIYIYIYICTSQQCILMD
jgi:hypothetical protein